MFRKEPKIFDSIYKKFTEKVRNILKIHNWKRVNTDRSVWVKKMKAAKVRKVGEREKRNEKNRGKISMFVTFSCG